MSRPQQNALLQEELDRQHQWREWVAMQHKLQTKPIRNVIDDDQPATIPLMDKIESTLSSVSSRVSDTAQSIGGAVGNAVAQPAQSGLLKKLAIGLAIPVAAAGSYYASTVINKPAAVQPTPPDGALIPWLRDNGYNIPPPAGER